jgi:hypothetical protein
MSLPAGYIKIDSLSFQRKNEYQNRTISSTKSRPYKIYNSYIMPTGLSDTRFTGDAASILQQNRDKLLQLNPNYHVFIYWDETVRWSYPGKYDMVDLLEGKFKSQESGLFSINYAYKYLVFKSGKIGYYSSTE